MNIILVMIPLSLLILAGAVAMFFWAVNHDQFEDMDSHGLLPLADDPEDAAPDDAVDASKVVVKSRARRG